MRRPLLILASALALLAVPGTAEARQCAGGRLLPEIVAFPPGHPSVSQVDVGGGAKHDALIFGTGLGNVGDGPLEMIGRRASLSTPVMRTTQKIRCKDGPAITRGDTGGMRFARVRTHFHWHLRDLERYRLVSIESGRSYYAGKRGFCLGDAYDLQDALPRHPTERQFSGDLSTACAKNKPKAKYVRLGLSVGWGDSYPEIIEGQFVDLHGVPAGNYRLLMETDPLDRIVMESRARDHRRRGPGAQLRRRRAGDPAARRVPDRRRLLEQRTDDAHGAARLHRARAARSRASPPSRPAEERQQAAQLGLLRALAGALEADGDQALAQLGVGEQRPDGGGGGLRVAGRDEHRGAVGDRAHAADVGGDHGRAGGERLEQHLRQALGPGDVQEEVAAAVAVEQPAVERDVAEQLGPVGDAELLQAGAQVGLERALADDLQPVRRAELGEDVGEQQRVLLRLQAPDGEQRVAVAAWSGCRRGRRR